MTKIDMLKTQKKGNFSTKEKRCQSHVKFRFLNVKFRRRKNYLCYLNVNSYRNFTCSNYNL